MSEKFSGHNSNDVFERDDNTELQQQRRDESHWLTSDHMAVCGFAPRGVFFPVGSVTRWALKGPPVGF